MAHVPVFDELDFDYLQALVGDARGVILDIGANNGADTLRLLEAFPNATVHAFEPDPRVIEKFKANVRSERVHLHECAIGAADGTATFHMSSGMPEGIPEERMAEVPQMYKEDWDQSGSLRAPKDVLRVWPWIKFEKQITVPVMTLDSFFRAHALTGIDFIWADTQGAESDLILGGRLALSRTRYFFTEYGAEEYYQGQASLEQLLELLPDFRLLEKFSMDILLENQVLKAAAERASSSFTKRLLRKFFS